MKEPHKIELILTPTGRGSSVVIDGQKIPYVQKVTVTADASKDCTRVHLELLALDGVVISGEVAEVKSEKAKASELS